MNLLANSIYDNVGGTRIYILRIVKLDTRMKEMNIPMADDFVVLKVLNSLPMKSEHLKISYDAQRKELALMN